MATELPKYRCNAPDPGSLVQGRLIPFGQEFSTSPSEHPRAMWLPLNAAAFAAFKKWNEVELPKIVNAQIKKKKLVGEKAATFREEETARLQRVANEPIIIEERMPDEEIERTREHLAALEAKKADILARRLPSDPIVVDPPEDPDKAAGKKKRTADS